MAKKVNAARLAEELGVTRSAITYRLRNGQTVEFIREQLGDPNRKSSGQRAAKSRSNYKQGPGDGQGQGQGQGPRMAGYTPSKMPAKPTVQPEVGKRDGKRTGKRASLIPEITESFMDEIKDDDHLDLALALVDGPISRNEAERRLSLAKAHKEEMLVAERRGELVERRLIDQFVNGMIAEAQGILLRIGSELMDRLAAETNPAKCKDMIDKEVGRALGKMSEFGV